MTASSERAGPTTPVALLSLSALAVLAAFCGLLLWTLVPLLFGWTSSVVVSGSMQPAVKPGDVVVTSPVREDQIVVGHVARFRDPAVPGRYLLHRIVRTREEDGLLVTQGDANRVADSTPISRSAVEGIGRLRIPWVGLPVHWFAERNFLSLTIFIVAIMTLCALVPAGWNWTGPPPRARPTPPPATDQPPADQSPADQPLADQPPADQPPAEQPPAEQPPADQPPAEQPPTEEPAPADEQPTPADLPAAEKPTDVAEPTADTEPEVDEEPTATGNPPTPKDPPTPPRQRPHRAAKNTRRRR